MERLLHPDGIPVTLRRLARDLDVYAAGRRGLAEDAGQLDRTRIGVGTEQLKLQIGVAGLAQQFFRLRRIVFALLNGRTVERIGPPPEQWSALNYVF